MYRSLEISIWKQIKQARSLKDALIRLPIKRNRMQVKRQGKSVQLPLEVPATPVQPLVGFPK
jgi:hypothetical protein